MRNWYFEQVFGHIGSADAAEKTCGSDESARKPNFGVHMVFSAEIILNRLEIGVYPSNSFQKFLLILDHRAPIADSQSLRISGLAKACLSHYIQSHSIFIVAIPK